MNDVIRGIAAAILFSAASSAASADATDDIIAEVLSNNPGLKAEESRLGAGVAAERAENVLADPSVDFSYKWGPVEHGDKIEAGISQEFEWPGVYSARGKASKNAEMASVKLLESKRLDCALQIKLLLIDIVNCRSRLEIVREAMKNLDDLAESKAKAFEHGEATVFDIKNIEIRRLALSLQVADTESQLDALRASLIAMNGGAYVDTDALTDYPADLLREESYYLDVLESSDPGIKAEEFTVNAAANRLQAEKMKRMPGFSLGYTFVREGGANFNGFTFGLRLPAWSRSNAVKASELLARSQADVLADALATRRASIISDYAAAERLALRCKSFDSVMESENEYNRLLRKALDGGSMTVLQYLTELENFINLRTEYANLRHSYALAVARLNSRVQ